MLALQALIVAATLAVVGTLVRQRTDYYLDREIDARLTALVKSFDMGPAGTAETPDDLSKLSRDWLFEVPLPENSVAGVGTEDRERLWTPQAQDLLRGVPNGLELLDYHSEEWKWWTLGSGTGSTRALTVPRRDARNHQIGTLVVAASRMRAVDTSRGLNSALNRASIIGLIVGVVLSLPVVRISRRPPRRRKQQGSETSHELDDLPRPTKPGPRPPSESSV